MGIPWYTYICHIMHEELIMVHVRRYSAARKSDTVHDNYQLVVGMGLMRNR